jgi:hypothetical protein
MHGHKCPAAALLVTTGLRWPAPVALRRGWGRGGLAEGAKGSAQATQELGDMVLGEKDATTGIT